MSIDEYLERIRANRTPDHEGGGPSVLIYTSGAKGFFSGELLDATGDGLLIRQRDGAELLILRRHVVAMGAAES